MAQTQDSRGSDLGQINQSTHLSAESAMYNSEEYPSDYTVAKDLQIEFETLLVNYEVDIHPSCEPL